MRTFLLTCALLFALTATAHGKFLSADRITAPEPLLPYCSWLADPAGKLSIDSITSAEWQGRFAALQGGIPLKSSGPVWLRLVLFKNQAGPGSSVPLAEKTRLVINLGELPPGKTRIFLSESTGQVQVQGVWHSEFVSSGENIPLPEPGMLPVSVYIRMDEMPGLWFSPLVGPEDSLSPPVIPPDLLLPGLLIAAAAACLLRAVGSRAQWAFWGAMYLLCILFQVILRIPGQSQGFGLNDLPALLAPGMALILLPHIGRCMFRTDRLSPIQDAALYLCSLLGVALALVPLIPGFDWMIRLFPLWTLLIIPVLPLSLGALASKKPGSLAFFGACAMPVLGGAVALYALLSGTQLHPLVFQSGIWGAAVGGLGLFLARIPAGGALEEGLRGPAYSGWTTGQEPFANVKPSPLALANENAVVRPYTPQNAQSTVRPVSSPAPAAEAGAAMAQADAAALEQSRAGDGELKYDSMYESAFNMTDESPEPPAAPGAQDAGGARGLALDMDISTLKAQPAPAPSYPEPAPQAVEAPSLEGARVISLVDDDVTVYGPDEVPDFSTGVTSETREKLGINRSGKSSPAPGGGFIFNLHALVREVHDVIYPLATAKGLLFSWYIAPSLPTLLQGDAPRLREALTLLLQNAVQSTQRGAVNLAVRQNPGSGSGTQAAGQNAPCEMLFLINDSGSAQRTDAGFFQAWELAVHTGGTFTVDYSPSGGTQISFTACFARPSEEEAARHMAMYPVNAEGMVDAHFSGGMDEDEPIPVLETINPPESLKRVDLQPDASYDDSEDELVVHSYPLDQDLQEAPAPAPEPVTLPAPAAPEPQPVPLTAAPELELERTVPYGQDEYGAGEGPGPQPHGSGSDGSARSAGDHAAGEINGREDANEVLPAHMARADAPAAGAAAHPENGRDGPEGPEGAGADAAVQEEDEDEDITELVTEAEQALKLSAQKASAYLAAASPQVLEAVDKAMSYSPPPAQEERSRFGEEADALLARPPARQPMAAADTPARILAGEMTASNRRLLIHYLEKLPYEHLNASSNDDVLAMARERDLGLIIFDADMPEQDIIKSILNLRAQEQEGGSYPASILVLTSHEAQSARMLGAGCSHTLTKPFMQEALLEIVAQAIPGLASFAGYPSRPAYSGRASGEWGSPGEAARAPQHEEAGDSFVAFMRAPLETAQPPHEERVLALHAEPGDMAAIESGYSRPDRAGEEDPEFMVLTDSAMAGAAYAHGPDMSQGLSGAGAVMTAGQQAQHRQAEAHSSAMSLSPGAGWDTLSAASGPPLAQSWQEPQAHMDELGEEDAEAGDGQQAAALAEQPARAQGSALARPEPVEAAEAVKTATGAPGSYPDTEPEQKALADQKAETLTGKDPEADPAESTALAARQAMARMAELASKQAQAPEQDSKQAPGQTSEQAGAQNAPSAGSAAAVAQSSQERTSQERAAGAQAAPAPGQDAGGGADAEGQALRAAQERHKQIEQERAQKEQEEQQKEREQPITVRLQPAKKDDEELAAHSGAGMNAEKPESDAAPEESAAPEPARAQSGRTRPQMAPPRARVKNGRSSIIISPENKGRRAGGEEATHRAAAGQSRVTIRPLPAAEEGADQNARHGAGGAQDTPAPALAEEAAPSQENAQNLAEAPQPPEVYFYPLPDIDGETLDSTMLPLVPGLIHFLRDILGNIKAAAGAGNSLVAQEGASRMAGRAEDFGLQRLSKIARCIERAAEADDLEAVSNLMTDLEPATERYITALDQSFQTFLNLDR
ncbi:response regulator [Desulfovibrio sp. OttesenSCG-928-A18]|nr:response regulator [Desulfovibrio sp. OttesenSCG-928-A18]